MLLREHGTKAEGTQGFSQVVGNRLRAGGWRDGGMKCDN